MGKKNRITDMYGREFLHSDTETDAILNSFYCGQIQALHHLLYYIFRAKGKYNIREVIRFIDGRYCYLIKEFPNFYNVLMKAEQESGSKIREQYASLFREMLDFLGTIEERKHDE